MCLCLISSAKIFILTLMSHNPSVSRRFRYARLLRTSYAQFFPRCLEPGPPGRGARSPVGRTTPLRAPRASPTPPRSARESSALAPCQPVAPKASGTTVAQQIIKISRSQGDSHGRLGLILPCISMHPTRHMLRLAAVPCLYCPQRHRSQSRTAALGRAFGSPVPMHAQRSGCTARELTTANA